MWLSAGTYGKNMAKFNYFLKIWQILAFKNISFLGYLSLGVCMNAVCMKTFPRKNTNFIQSLDQLGTHLWRTVTTVGSSRDKRDNILHNKTHSMKFDTNFSNKTRGNLRSSYHTLFFVPGNLPTLRKFSTDEEEEKKLKNSFFWKRQREPDATTKKGGKKKENYQLRSNAIGRSVGRMSILLFWLRLLFHRLR